MNKGLEICKIDMALWQYTFHVLPRQSVDTLSPNFLFIEGKGGFDDEPFWTYDPIDKSFFSSIANILLKAKSWSEFIDLYGNQESNCFEVLFKNNIVISVSFRIDFTSNYEHVLSNLIEFGILNGLLVLNEKLVVVPLNLESFKRILESSPQVEKYNKLLHNK